ncbi:MAG: peptidylprolyl isomerase [Thiothrix sp.]|nr:MAG: peptidylprolyl isomerase [Thiothrix sp.]
MSEMAIDKGKLVEFTYSITDDRGAVVEQIDLPVNYIHGGDSGMYVKIENAIEGHKAGETVSVSLTPEDGFGMPDPKLIFTDDLDNVPKEFHHIGAEAEFKNDEGETKTFRVTEIKDGKFTMDGNHPLAGQTIEFSVNILQVREATEEELSGKIPTGQAVKNPSSKPPTIN